ncbi:hypothetical protein Lepto7376_0212 [[Leptolyngbya] sp. PCC 7376]|uniref:hypothetical protein n=1 Tax=[Leptolyngbya] sp. PCC 7376 TaxID=111781 RepID=UPI00029F1494|nr:hypothetical protein [[Leptolyngbya] sp. PCC 7376]AFY36657.1 hypothetical protein Lepto7376_0212 [[Leptolyngbya] sp. PCC 7376]
MNKTPVQLKEQISSGWSLQFYSGDRRLLWSLDPSHAWTFLIGTILGLSTTLLFGFSYPEETVKSVDPVIDQTVTPLLKID